MPNIQSVLKAEIARLARKEVRGEVAALRKSSSQHRGQIAALRRQVQTLQKAVQRLSRGGGRSPASAADEAGEEGTARRFSAARLAKTRQKLALSAADFGALIGVSGQSIYKWEAGEVRPRRAQLEAIAQVRGLGKREAAARLETVREQLRAAETPARRRAPARKHGTEGVGQSRKRA